ncbi:MAG TPA: flagellar export chaperone FliS [Lachnospiraceae bacterium]|nr:flagellar export chaperone FliS [Lachnospiraceae bacterium]
MALKNPYAKYANERVTTASPAELTLMLYEGAIKFCNIAKLDIEKGELGDAMGNVQKARKIIVELQSTLDFQYPVAKDFDIIYNYIFQLMVTANREHTVEAVDAILVELRELRDAWKQVMKAAKNPT